MKHVFTYGSLMFPEVWRCIVTQEYVSQEATILGYERRGVVGEHYPAVVAVKGSEERPSVSGTLYLNVNAKDLAALDVFEGEQYRRVTLPVVVGDGVLLDAEVYVWRRRFNARLSSYPWNLQHFKRHGLTRFKRSYRGFGGGKSASNNVA